MDGGAWWAAVHGVAKSRTRLRDFTFTFHFRALEKEMATHSSVLAWRIPGTGEPGGLPSMGSQSRTRLKRLSSSSNTPDWEETSRLCVWIIVSWQSEVLEYPKDWSLLTPLIVSRSRIQVCGVMEGNCAKISTQIFSDQWSSHTYSQQHKYHRLALFPWHVHSSIFHSALKTKHIQGVWRNGKSRHILRILFALSPQGNLVIWSSKRGHNKQTHC